MILATTVLRIVAVFIGKANYLRNRHCFSTILTKISFRRKDFKYDKGAVTKCSMNYNCMRRVV